MTCLAPYFMICHPRIFMPSAVISSKSFVSSPCSDGWRYLTGFYDGERGISGITA